MDFAASFQGEDDKILVSTTEAYEAEEAVDLPCTHIEKIRQGIACGAV